jgi:hypothetical protein
LQQNEVISILLPVSNADINNYKLTLTYDIGELELLDAYEITETADTQSIYIEEANTHIFIERKDTTGIITYIIQTDTNTNWSGTAGSIRFISLLDATVTLYYSVTEK